MDGVEESMEGELGVKVPLRLYRWVYVTLSGLYTDAFTLGTVGNSTANSSSTTGCVL